jgi:hypothetical protein
MVAEEWACGGWWYVQDFRYFVDAYFHHWYEIFGVHHVNSRVYRVCGLWIMDYEVMKE